MHGQGNAVARGGPVLIATLIDHQQGSWRHGTWTSRRADGTSRGPRSCKWGRRPHSGIHPPATTIGNRAREHFNPSDLPSGRDVARHPKVARILANRCMQFFLILPNQLVCWAAILLGLLGSVVRG